MDLEPPGSFDLNVSPLNNFLRNSRLSDSKTTNINDISVHRYFSLLQLYLQYRQVKTFNCIEQVDKFLSKNSDANRSIRRFSTRKSSLHVMQCECLECFAHKQK